MKCHTCGKTIEKYYILHSCKECYDSGKPLLKKIEKQTIERVEDNMSWGDF